MRRRIFLHALFWLVYWFIYTYTYSRYDGDLWKYGISEGIQMSGRMISVYLSLWQARQLNSRENAWRVFLSFAVFSCAGGLLNRLIKLVYLVPVYFPDATIKFWDYRLMVDIFDCVVAVGTALTAHLYFQRQDLILREERLRSEKLEAELKALKNQVHPHFLFNTINNLYALARIKSAKTAPVALQLANLLRYVLYEAAQKEVRLEQEIKNLQDYIELEKIRFDADRLRIEEDIRVENPGKPISPLLLLPLVENAFKHGASEQRQNAWIRLQIVEEAGDLTLLVQNSKPPENRATSSAGLGLKNLERQLELLYPGAASLKTEDLDDVFTARLHIRL